MSTPGASLPSRSPGVEAPLLQAIVRGVTWKKVLVAEAFALTLALFDYLNMGADVPLRALQTELVVNSVGALLILVGAVTADEAVRRGARMSVACPASLVTASLSAGILQWGLCRWLGVIDCTAGGGSPLAGILSTSMYIAVMGGLGMMAYLQRQNALRLVDGLRIRELHRVQAERQLLEANLSVTRSQIDPAALSRQLLLIRIDYAAGQPEAEMRLDALIQDLRTRVAQSLALTRAAELQP